MKKLNLTIGMALFASVFALASCSDATEESSTASSTTQTSDTSASEAEKEVVDNYQMKIVAPTGAPAVGLADIKQNKADKYSVNTVGDVSLYFADKNEDKVVVDAIVAPVNVGAKMYKNLNGKFKLAGVLTWGNLYFVSKQEFTMSDVTAENTMVFGEGKIPGMIVDYVLASYDVEPLRDAAHTKETTQGTFEALKGDTSNMIYLIAEPVLTVAKAQIADLHIVSVQEEYEKITGQNTYPQAGIFVRTTTIENHKSVVDQLITDLTASSELLKSNTAQYAEYVSAAGFLTQPVAVLTKALPNCAVNFVKAKDAKAAIEKEVTIDPSMFGGANPEAGFYY